MIRNRMPIDHPDILTALCHARDWDRRHYEPNSDHELQVRLLRADIDAIIASASGAKAAAELCGGDRSDAVIAAAIGLAA